MEIKDIHAGLRVKYVSNNHGDYPSNPLWGGKLGKIGGTVTSDQGYIEVRWDNGEHNSYSEYDLEPLDVPGGKMISIWR